MFSNGSLVINSVVESEEGRYTCTATNRRGLSSASTAIVRVIGRSVTGQWSVASTFNKLQTGFEIVDDILQHFQFHQNSKTPGIRKKPCKLIKDFPCFVLSLRGMNQLAFTGKKMEIS